MIAMRGKHRRGHSKSEVLGHDRFDDPSSVVPAIPMPRTEESRRAWRDGCIAREMRKPNRPTRTAAGALLLFWGLRLLVRHACDHAA